MTAPQGEVARRSNRQRWLGAAVLVFTTAASVGLWYRWRTQSPPVPQPTRETLFRGVTYTREVRRKPRPQVIHIVTVDLQAPDIGFLVTPGDPRQRRPLRARTTSQFSQEFHVQVAINGDFFTPWHSKGLWNYYPHVGDPVGVDGFAASRGVVYSKGDSRRGTPQATLYLSRDNRAGIQKPAGPIYNALSGSDLLLHNGKPVAARLSRTAREALHPRTAVGLSRDAQRLILVLIDGRQSGYSEGAAMSELPGIMTRHGAHSAIALDGGGSTTLITAGSDGKPVVLNSPIDNWMPGRERPVANHLGIFAAPLSASR